MDGRPWAEAALDWVYPPKCALCGRLGFRGLCPSCEEEFEPLARTMTQLGQPGPLDGQVCLFQYRGRVRQAVRRLKYERVTALAKPMALLLAECAAPVGVTDADLLVPVPIHWRRRCERGFNQAELLARALPSDRLRPKVLRRVRATRPQVGLTVPERLRNLRDAFRATTEVAGRSVALIDDVLTSGGTALACAAALKAAGATHVVALAFAGWGDDTLDLRA